MLSEGEQHVGALCETLNQSQPAVSHHLALLRHGGIIAPRRQGKNNFYSLTDTGEGLAKIVKDLAVDRAVPGKTRPPGEPERGRRVVLLCIAELASNPPPPGAATIRTPDHPRQALSILDKLCYTLVGWSDDRVAPLALPDPVPAPLPRLPAHRASPEAPFFSTLKASRGSSLLSFRSLILAKKLYVGNLTYNVNESDLEALFTPFGTVQSAQIIVDRDTNRSKGFGFVEMDTDAQAQAAIQGLNGHDHDGRNLTVNEAKPREARRAAAATAAVAGGGGGYGGGGGRY